MPYGRILGAAALLVFGLALAVPIPAYAADPPTVSMVSPSTGSAAGGTAVTITGTGFAVGATVTFDGAAATGVVVVNATTITANTPAGAVGPAVVAVTNTDAQGGTLSGGFSYVGGAPTVTSVTPNTGPSSGGTSVTIAGTGFATGATVRFGGTPATGVVVSSSTQITATTPAHAAGSVNVEVTNPDAQNGTRANAFTYQAVAAPSVSGVTPSSGTTGGGTPVTITGTGFVAGATVTFGSNSATNVNVVSAGQISATTPAGSGSVAVTVRNPDNQSGTRASAFTYISTPAPNLTSLNPTSGPIAGGNVVTLSGTGFLPGADVRFGSLDSSLVTFISGTQLQATVPAVTSSGTVAVRVTNTDGRSDSLSSAYTYVGAPTIASVSPNAGSMQGGTTVAITGTNFAGGATVTIGGLAANSVTVVNTTRITFTTPAHSQGTVAVSVQNVGGQSATLNNAYTYLLPPTISAVSPTSGPTTGGTTVSIFGTNFTSGMTVRFGGVNASNVVRVSSTELRAVSPAGSAGTTSITVLGADNVAGVGSPLFQYIRVAQPGEIIGGALPASGFGLIVVQGGTIQQIASRSGCDALTLAFWVTNAQGEFIVYVPGTTIGAVNAAFLALFPGGAIPTNTAMVARCR